MLRLYLVGALLVVSASCLHMRGETAFVQSGLPKVHARMASKRCALRMDVGNGQLDEGSDSKLQELIQTRTRLLQEKADLLKKRKQSLMQDISKLERDQQAAPKSPASSMRASTSDSISPADGIFGKPASQESQNRRQFVNNIFTGIAVTIGGLGVLGIVLAPGIEKLAYLSFSTLFEEGAIYLTKQTGKVFVTDLFISVFVASL
jgi:hypothetical protein